MGGGILDPGEAPVGWGPIDEETLRKARRILEMRPASVEDAPGSSRDEKLSYLRGQADSASAAHPESAHLYRDTIASLEGSVATSPRPAGLMGKLADFGAQGSKVALPQGQEKVRMMPEMDLRPESERVQVMPEMDLREPKSSPSIGADVVEMARKMLGQQPQSSIPPNALQEATRASRENRFVADMARIGAMGIGRGNDKVYDALDRNASVPLENLRAEQEGDRHRMAAEAARADADPNSPQSQAAKAVFAKMMQASGAQVPPEVLAGMTAAKLKALMPQVEPMLKAEAARLEHETARTHRDTAREDQQRFAAEGREDQQRHQAEQNALSRESTDALRRLTMALMAGKKLDADVKDLSEDLGKGGAPGFYQQVKTAKAIMAKHPKDLPGFGRLAGHLPDEAIEADGIDLRQSVGQMLAEYRKGVTGAGMSDAERAEYGRITGLIQSGNDDSVRVGVDTLVRAVDSRVASRMAGSNPQAAEEYGKRQPWASEAVQRAAGGGGEATGPHGPSVVQNGITYSWNPETKRYE